MSAFGKQPQAAKHSDVVTACRSRNAGQPRKLPPYGREVLHALSSGESLNLWVYANRPDPWILALRHRHVFGPASILVLPPGTDPEEYRWPPVRELLADITDLPGLTMRALAHVLVRDGVQLAYLLDARHHQRSLRVRAKRHAP